MEALKGLLLEWSQGQDSVGLDAKLHYLMYGLMTLVIVYLFTRKSYRPKAPIVLTPKEINELLTSWEPKPLVGDIDPYYKLNIESVPFVTK